MLHTAKVRNYDRMLRLSFHGGLSSIKVRLITTSSHPSLRAENGERAADGSRLLTFENGVSAPLLIANLSNVWSAVSLVSRKVLLLTTIHSPVEYPEAKPQFEHFPAPGCVEGTRFYCSSEIDHFQRLVGLGLLYILRNRKYNM